MITVNNTIWTDPTETLDLHAHFYSVYGKDVAEPACHVCSKATGYIVEEARVQRDNQGKVISVKPVKKGVAFMIRLSNLKVLVKDDKIYLPMFKCEDCNAKYEATLSFNCNNHNPPNLGNRCLLEGERGRYKNMFQYKISDLEKQASASTTKSTARYTLAK